MKNYEVQIKETLKKCVIIEAKNKQEALDIAEENYNYGKTEYVLDYDNLQETEFKTLGTISSKEIPLKKL